MFFNTEKPNKWIEFFIWFLLLIFFVQIQFTISHVYIRLLPIPTPAVVTSLVVGGFFLYYLMYRKQLKIVFNQTMYSNPIFKFLFLFSLTVLFSSLSTLWTTNTIVSSEYHAYFSSGLYERILYYIVYISLIFLTLTIIKNKPDDIIRKIINIYPTSLYIIILVGFWQFLYFTYNVPFLDIETRSYVHSSEGSRLFNFRLTSFADEPSYLGPIIIDFLILGVLIFKKWYTYVPFILIPSIFILLFSFSLSAYVNIILLMLFLVIVLFFHPIFPRKILYYLILIGLVVLGILLLFKTELILQLFNPIFGRLATIFDLQQHSRLYMYIMPLYWLFDHSIVSGLFGFGPGSFEFLSASKILPNGMQVATSSNNMYVDILFENGVIGLVLILYGLFSILRYLIKHYKLNIYYFIAMTEFIHLLITSLYRADYSTPRFWGILLIISLLVLLGQKRESLKQEGYN